MRKYLGLVFGLIFSVSVGAQSFSFQRSAMRLKFFNGQIFAELSWVKPPTVSQKNQLKIDLKMANGEAYDIDAFEIQTSLFMTAMPEMGSFKQLVVSVADPSGHPIPGSFMINAMKLSMAGEWTLSISLPHPDGSGTIDTQKFQFATN